MIAVLLAALVAAAAEPAGTLSPPAPIQDPVASFEVELEAAKSAWFQGDVDLARESFQLLYLQLLGGVETPLERAGEVAIYVGEIAYDGGDLASAESAWTWLLQRDPDFPISPYHHPIEVIGLFESVRSRVKADIAALPPILPQRYPAWGWVPFGVPQFKQGQPISGTFFLVSQAALATASIGLWVEIARNNPKPGDAAPPGLLVPVDEFIDGLIAEKYR